MSHSVTVIVNDSVPYSVYDFILLEYLATVAAFCVVFKML